MEPVDLRKQESTSPVPTAAGTPLLQTPKRGWWHRLTGEPMKKWEKIIGVIALILFLCIFYVVLDANKYQATVHIISGQGKVGVNPTTEKLDFGDLSPGTSAVRRVSVQNQTIIPVYVMVLRVGGINDLMKLNKNFFTLPPKSSTELEFSVYMPASAKEGDTLTGRVFLFKIPFVGGKARP